MMYVKPLMRVYSCLMVPPWALALSFALRVWVSDDRFLVFRGWDVTCRARRGEHRL